MSDPIKMERADDPAGALRLGSALRERCEQPPSFAELRYFFVMLLQRHFSNAADYGKYTDVMACTTYNLEDPDRSELPVGLAFGSPEISASARGVRIFMQDFTFQPAQIGMETSYSQDNATIYTTKKAVGTLNIVVSHENAEIAHMLAESVIPFLEGTRIMWMDLFHITAFNTIGLGGQRKQIPAPGDKLFQATVTCQIQCQIITALTEESLRLKKISFDVNLV